MSVGVAVLVGAMVGHSVPGIAVGILVPSSKVGALVGTAPASRTRRKKEKRTGCEA